jgi:peptidoglycan/xylan/chitin deacetylase (PgdA/CDA1 family)
VDAGWNVGSHTHNHYDLGFLARRDPSGAEIREQLERCDDLIRTRLGRTPLDFAYTGTTWSRLAEREVARRYRFARLWIAGRPYDTDEGRMRYADLVGASGDDEADGGPPFAARYVSETTDRLKLPSMELEHLIFEFDAFRRYLAGALEPAASDP